jgi:membrane fusion protein, multidrug efflux system
MRTPFAAMSLSVALLGWGCGESKSSTPSVTNAAPVPALSASKAAPMTDTSEAGLVVSGPIIVEHQMDLTAQLDGVVAKIFQDAPVRVKAGAVLAQLDDRQIVSNLEGTRAKSRSIAADLKNWQAEAEVLKADYVRAQRLWDLGLTSQEQLQHAKFKAESDQWDVKRIEETLNTSHQEERSLELELEKTKIVAPFDGVIARRYVREGQSVAKGDRLFWVTAESPLMMRFTLPEQYFGHLSPVQQFEITSPDLPGEKHAARLKGMSPVVDPASGTFEVLVELTGDRGAFHPGMTANLRVEKNR